MSVLVYPFRLKPQEAWSSRVANIGAAGIAAATPGGGAARGASAAVVIVHGLAQARAACMAARAGGHELLLLSGVGAGSYAGAAWWRGLISHSGHSGHSGADILDCGDDGAAAIEALRLGQRRLVISGPHAGGIASAGASVGAAVVARPQGLDLAEAFRDADIAHALRRYFSTR
jgi:hypothetical protein